MITLKEVAALARQDADDRAYVTKVFKNHPEGCTPAEIAEAETSRWLAENSIRLMEELTTDLAKRAAANDTSTTH